MDIQSGVEGLKQNIGSIKDYVSERTMDTSLGNNIEDNYYRLITNGKKVDDILSRRILDKAEISPEDQKAIYSWMEDPKKSLTEVQRQAYENFIKPLVEGSNRMWAALKDREIPLPVEDSPQHVTRVIKGRGSFLDRLADGFRKTSMGGKLSKTAGFLKKRTMMAIEDEGGNRVVVSMKEGRVTGWNKGDGFDMGRIKMESYENLTDKDLKPIQDRITKLQREKNILTATKSRTEAARLRLDNIDKEILSSVNKMAEVEDGFANGLSGRVFVDKNGKAWKVADAMTDEIEANTKLRYYRTPLVSELQRFNKLNQIKRATDFLESTKNELENQERIKKMGSYDVDKDWVTTELPQFRGYLMPKRIADILDHFYDQAKKGNTGALTKLNLFLRTTIFFNPLIHIPNITVHWVVARGWQWANPIGYVRMVKSGLRAIQATLELNNDYVQALDRGAPLLYSDVKNIDLYRAYFNKASFEMENNPTFLEEVKRSFGLDNEGLRNVMNVINPYKWSSRATWSVNDIATLQAIFEEMDRGKGWGEAISETGKHIPNYRLPTTLFGSKKFMDAIRNPNLTMFSAYHYGALRSYFEMAKSLVAGKSGQERIDAIGKIAMLGIVTYVIYPELDKLIKGVTGNKNAYARRAGASTFLYNTQLLLEGKKDFTDWLTAVVTPSVLVSLPLDIYKGYLKAPTLTEFEAFPAKTATQFGSDLAGNLISPLGYAEQVATGKRSLGDTLLQFIGVSTPKSTSSQKGVNTLVYDEKPRVLKKAKELITRGKTDEARQLIETFNQNLRDMLIGTLTDRGYSQQDAENVFNKWLHSPDAKVGTYFIRGISQESLQSYQKKRGRSSMENLILK